MTIRKHVRETEVPIQGLSAVTCKFALANHLKVEEIFTKSSIREQQNDDGQQLVFREDFLLRARRRVTDTVLTAPVDRITATDIEEQLVEHYGAHLARNRDGLRELIDLTLEGKPLYDLLDAVKKPHEKIKAKSGGSVKEIGVSTASRPSLEELATTLFGKNLETKIAGDKLDRTPQVYIEETALYPPLPTPRQIRSGSECFPLQPGNAADLLSGSDGTIC